MRALRADGLDAVLINNNPETVSTDFDVASRLYVDPLTLEDVLHVVEAEGAEGVVVQVGGQTGLNLAGPLAEAGVKVFGTSVESLDVSEDRGKFGALLNRLGIAHPAGDAVRTLADGIAVADRLGYPLLVRPSYVLGGRGMEIVATRDELVRYLRDAFVSDGDHPVLIDVYLEGTEVEVDAISDGDAVYLPGIMRHIERAGVHSGDSVAVFPAPGLSPEEHDQVVAHTVAIARALAGARIPQHPVRDQGRHRVRARGEPPEQSDDPVREQGRRRAARAARGARDARRVARRAGVSRGDRPARADAGVREGAGVQQREARRSSTSCSAPR